MPEDDSTRIRKHAMWSGVITFGLVSVPVALLPAQRPQRISLRMLAPDGTPLRRRYYCSKEDRMLDAEEIVRGYEIEKEQYIVISDDELEALAPEKSKEIDLRRFVPIEQIDPAYFKRAYFLSPLGEVIKPYRLLAAAMEASGRAGIATFVMRGKEYLVAILSQNGILRAETMRFADELRTPADIGLEEEPPRLPEADLKAIEAEIRAAAAPELDTGELTDPNGRKLQHLIEEKRARGQGVLTTGGTAADDEEDKEEDNVIDLMEIIKRSIGLKAAPADNAPKGELRSFAEHHQSRQALYEAARALDISGRSKMTKEELAAAVREKQQARKA
jgi:DNA end-binding protein Ku